MRNGEEFPQMTSNEIREARFPDSLHVITYDVQGTVLSTGRPKPSRQTGIVTQTHQLLSGFARRQPGTRLAVTQTGAKQGSAYRLRTPEGQTVLAQGVQSSFPRYLSRPGASGKDPALVRRYYEELVHDPDNPVYESLARQYAAVIRRANIPNLLLQNPNPIVSVLKAEQFGYLDALTAGQLNVTAVVHDVATYEARLGYVRQRVDETRTNLKLVAVSGPVRRQLDTIGFPAREVFSVSNGLDVHDFRARLRRGRERSGFEAVRRRNGLPHEGAMVLVVARRVEHKGHRDVIRAVRILRDLGRAGRIYVAFTGASMLDTRSLEYEETLSGEIASLGLRDKVFMLDVLDSDEVAACYGQAHAAVLASTQPEGFAYANIEAMLARVPVITTRHGGPLSYITHGVSGLFVEPHDPAGIASALDTLLTHPCLHTRIAGQGQRTAEQFTVNNMVDGYLSAIRAGCQRVPLRINPGRPFEKIGDGMHTEVFRRPPGKFVTQLFKQPSKLTLERVDREYRYLVEAYAAIPGLIPRQRLILPQPATSLSDAVIIKRYVELDASRNPLHRTDTERLDEATLRQIADFVRITRGLFTYTSPDPALRMLGPRIPDIIDPAFANLVVDVDGNLRLLDTNMLISTAALLRLAVTGEKLDINKRRIHALALRRLMYLESRFLGRTEDTLRCDPFYAQFIAREDFDALFRDSARAGEPLDSSKACQDRAAG
jgi:glycosyltransferase involved in cell wall biosynthesis